MTRRLIVTGRVQGVGYRDWTVGAARGLGLSGWVRNRPEGSVEILADGPEAAIEALVRQCREGPPAARVDDVEVTASDEQTESGFRHR